MTERELRAMIASGETLTVEYERKSGKEMRIDALLTIAELRGCGKASFDHLVAIAQRKPETIREELEDWVAGGLIAKYGTGRGDTYVLTEDVRRAINGKLFSERMSKAELDDCHDKIRVWLIANGTIKRAKICELCDVSTKQAKTIIDSFCKKYSVSIQEAGRSTTYKWND